jgi:hypothetical protein
MVASSVAGLFAGDQRSAHEIVHKLVVVVNYSCGIPLTNEGNRITHILSRASHDRLQLV